VTTIGIDPGPTPGICVLGVGTPVLLQCDATSLIPLVGSFVELYEDEDQWGPLHLAVENWAVGPIGRTAVKAAELIRDQIGELRAYATIGPHTKVYVHARTAAAVKPWATDRRLAAAGLLKRTTGMPHARDSARHALFSHVRDTGAPDPLSRSRAT
jgi:hypothetical protein